MCYRYELSTISMSFLLLQAAFDELVWRSLLSGAVLVCYR